jgi:hypothetical protein
MQIARMSSRGIGFVRPAQTRSNTAPRRITPGQSINRSFIDKLAGFVPPVKR